MAQGYLDAVAHCLRRSALPVFAFIATCGCEAEVQDTAVEPPFDEWSVDDVWHRAKLRGVAFRAAGQEPGWLLEITNGVEILVVTEDGENINQYPYVEPVVYPSEGRTQYLLENDGVTVEIRGVHCIDTMSGEELDVSVSIIIAERRLEGCGRALF